jgi:hypothetical protein
MHRRAVAPEAMQRSVNQGHHKQEVNALLLLFRSTSMVCNSGLFQCLVFRNAHTEIYSPASMDKSFISRHHARVVVAGAAQELVARATS